MALNYTTYVSQLANLLVIQSTGVDSAAFSTFLPGCIDYAEQRIYRELDMLNETVTDTGTLSSGIRNVTLPTNKGTFIVVEEFNVFTPSGTSSARNQLQPASKEFIDAVYGSQSDANGIPQYFAPISQDSFIVGPSPDLGYNFEIVGIQRPATLSSANSSTILTQYAPELFMAASMVFATGYQRDWGAQSDDPQMAQSWEQQYKTLFQSAEAEQLRAAYRGPAWQAYGQSPPFVTPQRT